MQDERVPLLPEPVALPEGANLGHLQHFVILSIGCEIFSVVALSFFLPITLESFARAHHEGTEDCTVSDTAACKADLFGFHINTASYALYTYSLSVAILALTLISVGEYADSPRNRNKLLFFSAIAGSISGMLFLAFPVSSPVWYLTSLLTIISGVSFGLNVLCLNSSIPSLAKQSLLARKAHHQALNTSEDDRDEAFSTYHKIVSSQIVQISAVGLSAGYATGLVVLTICLIPLKLLQGSIRALQISIFLAGVLWLTAALVGEILRQKKDLEQSTAQRKAISFSPLESWRNLFHLVKEASHLKQVWKFLLVWVFLSDGFATITSTALLFAKSDLKMPPTQLLFIGFVVPFCAALSTIAWPQVAHAFNVSNLRMLLYICLFASLIPIYACLGFVPFLRQRQGFGSLTTPTEIFLLSAFFGSLYGSFQAYARSVFGSLLPPGQEARFFGLYSITNKSASFLGPALVGIAGQLTGSLRGGFIVILFGILAPLPLLASIDMESGRKDAEAYSNIQTAGEADL